MALPVIEPYVHHCWVPSPAGGYVKSQDVEPYQYAYHNKCGYCGGALATPEEMIAHIYTQLRP